MNFPQIIPMPAASITKSASLQTYYTIRFLVDRERVEEAYLAYAYFRWVDDRLDAVSGSRSERSAFIHRQKLLVEECYRGAPDWVENPEEQMLIELIGNDSEEDSGLRSYINNMMTVMAFDAERRGRLISQMELNNYTHWLAGAVTEAMHYFIGHNCPSPHDETRYLAVTAAHITHMLRDTFDDIAAGYYNIPLEVLKASRITPQDVESDAYRAWVRSRVQLARSCFQNGREYLNQLGSLRCRLAGHAYAARFELLLDTMEGDEFQLRSAYNERGNLEAGLHAGWRVLSSILPLQKASSLRENTSAQPHPERRP